ncbi:MAG: hypothetical protein MSC55_01425 [Faecalibacterium sp.]|nr:hypothetical protein [Faecalibacterium sp.]
MRTLPSVGGNEQLTEQAANPTSEAEKAEATEKPKEETDHVLTSKEILYGKGAIVKAKQLTPDEKSEQETTILSGIVSDAAADMATSVVEDSSDEEKKVRSLLPDFDAFQPNLTVKAHTAEDETKNAETAPKEAQKPQKRDMSSFAFKNDNSANGNYLDAFSDFYNRNTSETMVETTEVDEKSGEIVEVQKPIPTADLKTRLYAEGFKMRVYTKANSENYYAQNFLAANKIGRDCGIIMYLLILVETLSGWLILKDALPVTYYLCVCAFGLAVPVLPLIVYLLNPNRRIRANFNFKMSVLYRFMVFLNVFVLLLLVGFFGFKADLKDVSTMVGPIIVPSILALNLPISSVVYFFLYNSGKYHIS